MPKKPKKPTKPKYLAEPNHIGIEVFQEKKKESWSGCCLDIPPVLLVECEPCPIERNQIRGLRIYSNGDIQFIYG